MSRVRNNMVLSVAFLLFRKAKILKKEGNKSLKKGGGVLLAELGDSLTNSVLTGLLVEPFPSRLPVSKKEVAVGIAVSVASLHDSRGHMTLCKGGSRQESLGMWIDMPAEFS